MVVGPTLLKGLGPAGAAALAASAGMVRWSVTAVTAWLPAMALVEPLHGLTFALSHLACSADAVCGCPAGPGCDSSGDIRRRRGRYDDRHNDTGVGSTLRRPRPAAFWVMALHCATALPIACRRCAARSRRPRFGDVDGVVAVPRKVERRSWSGPSRRSAATRDELPELKTLRSLGVLEAAPYYMGTPSIYGWSDRGLHDESALHSRWDKHAMGTRRAAAARWLKPRRR